MKTSKSQLALVMTRMWAIAKEAAKKFGGSSKQYLSESLKMAWAENQTKISYRLTGDAPYQGVEFVVSKGGKTFVGTRYNITWGKNAILNKNCTIELDEKETLVLSNVFDAAFEAELDARQKEYDRRWEKAQKSEAAYKKGIADGTIKPTYFDEKAYFNLQNEIGVH